MSEYVNHKPGFFEKLLLKLNVSRFDIVKNINGKEHLYLRRFHLLKNSKIISFLSSSKYENLYLHHILMPDEDAHMHSHPWDYAVFMISGGYEEIKPEDGWLCLEYNKEKKEEHQWQWKNRWTVGKQTQKRYWKPFSFRKSKAAQLHKILPDNFKKTWTLFFAGKRIQKWGFQTEDGFVPWDEYLAKYSPEQLKNTKPDRKDPDSL